MGLSPGSPGFPMKSRFDLKNNIKNTISFYTHITSIETIGGYKKVPR